MFLKFITLPLTSTLVLKHYLCHQFLWWIVLAQPFSMCLHVQLKGSRRRANYTTMIAWSLPCPWRILKHLTCRHMSKRHWLLKTQIKFSIVSKLQVVWFLEPVVIFHRCNRIEMISYEIVHVGRWKCLWWVMKNIGMGFHEGRKMSCCYVIGTSWWW